MTEQIYYHFVQANKHLGYDRSEQEVYPGLTLKTEKPIALCDYGFHASQRPLDALKNAPSNTGWLCGVTLGADVIHGNDKAVSSERTVVWMLKVDKLLIEFACWCAEQAFDVVRTMGVEPDPRSIEAVRITRLWLVDQATDAERAAARAAAREAAWDAARDAAWAAAWEAAGDAARDAAWDAARDAARAAQNDHLTALIRSALAESEEAA